MPQIIENINILRVFLHGFLRFFHGSLTSFHIDQAAGSLVVFSGCLFKDLVILFDVVQALANLDQPDVLEAGNARAVNISRLELAVGACKLTGHDNVCRTSAAAHLQPWSRLRRADGACPLFTDCRLSRSRGCRGNGKG